MLSEENKHFIGSYIILAHEISHSVHYKKRSDSITYPNWFIAMWRKVIGEQRRLFEERINSLRGSCQNCPISDYLYNFINNTHINIREFEQNVADLIALLIGGPTTCLALIDQFLNCSPDIRYLTLRPSFLHGYCFQNNLTSDSSLFENEILKMHEGWLKYLPTFETVNNLRCPEIGSEITPCFILCNKLGEISGKLFAYYDSNILNEFRTELPSETTLFSSGVNSITSALVKNKFSIPHDVNERICSCLVDRKSCTSEDPRHIIHCYYTSYRERMPIDYVTILHSLAYYNV